MIRFNSVQFDDQLNSTILFNPKPYYTMRGFSVPWEGALRPLFQLYWIESSNWTDRRFELNRRIELNFRHCFSLLNKYIYMYMYICTHIYKYYRWCQSCLDVINVVDVFQVFHVVHGFHATHVVPAPTPCAQHHVTQIGALRRGGCVAEGLSESVRNVLQI